MGFFSNLFGGSKQDKAINAAFEKIRLIIEDNHTQLSVLPSELQNMIRANPACDQIPGASGPFGFCETNPIPANGPIGEVAYLSKLETNEGERIVFHRLGSKERIDVYEGVTFSGSRWFLFYLDMYYPRKSRQLPSGFRLTKEVAQFSGFNRKYRNFPYDFEDGKRDQSESGLIFAYMPMSKISQQLAERRFNRPSTHSAALEALSLQSLR